MTTEEFQRKLTAILSADVQGYSRLMGEDEDSTVRTLKTYRELMSSLIERYHGRVVDSPGDNLLSEFESVRDAVRCAFEIQEELRIRNEELPENRRMRFRIGINLGDVIKDGDRIYGDGINVAARVEGLAEGGGISISGTVYDSIKNKLAMHYEFQGEHSVKNIKDPVRVYRIRMEPDDAAPIVKEKESKVRTWQRVAFPVLAILILVAVAYIVFDKFYIDRRTIENDVASRVSELASPTVEEEETEKTIAVLPFENLSSDPEQEYFVDGLSEELLNSLAKINSLRVTSRTSSFAFKDTDKTLKEVAGVLGVEHILEGSVRKSGDALRITAQLIRVKDDSYLWSETYDRKLEDIFAIQEGIAEAVADELKVALGIEKTYKLLGGTGKEKAYEFYLIAKGYFGAPPLDNRALKSIDTAIELSPDFALAWSLKARIHQGLSLRKPDEQFLEELGKGLHAAQRAIEIEPDLPDAYNSLGVIKSNMGELIEAENDFRRAIELVTDPFLDVQVFIDYAFHCRFVGSFKKADENIEAQLRNDPLNPNIRGGLMASLDHTGDGQWANEEYQYYKLLFETGIINNRQLEIYNEMISYYRFLSGDVLSPEEFVSIKIFSISETISNIYRKHFSSPNEAIKNLRSTYANEKHMNESFLSTVSILSAYVGVPEIAMDAIEKSKDTTKFYATSYGVIWYPIFHDVRQLPRFKEFIREIGLVDYWEQFGWPDLCHPTDDGDFVCD